MTPRCRRPLLALLLVCITPLAGAIEAAQQAIEGALQAPLQD